MNLKDNVQRTLFKTMFNISDPKLIQDFYKKTKDLDNEDSSEILKAVSEKMPEYLLLQNLYMSEKLNFIAKKLNAIYVIMIIFIILSVLNFLATFN